MRANHFLSAVEKKDIPLTPRQIEILQLYANGLSQDQIALELGIYPQSVKNHIFFAMDRIGLPRRNRQICQLVVYALWLGLII